MSNQNNVQEHEEQMHMKKFNPNEHLIQLKNRQGASDYLPVQWRLVWFREAFPHGSIETELVHLDLDKETEEEVFVWSQEKRRSEKQIKTAKGVAIFRATVRDGQGGVATGTKMEKAASFADFLEKAETGSIGRALAALGYGTQFAPELEENHRIVDAPVDRAAGGGNGHSYGENPAATRYNAANRNGNGVAPGGTSGYGSSTTTSEDDPEAVVTEKQVASIRKLCERMGKAEPANVTTISFLNAKKLIQQLTAEYKESQQNSRAS